MAKLSFASFLLPALVDAASVCDPNRDDYFCIEVGSPKANGSTEANYLHDRQLITRTYTGQIQKRFNRPLLIPNLWTSPYFGGGAQLLDSDFELNGKPTAKIVFFGGTIRSQSAKGLSFLTGLCHEVGHFLSDGPRQDFPGSEWSAIEGSADFFAAAQCLPKLFSIENQLVRKLKDLDPEVLQFCQGHLLCANVVQSGLELVNMFRENSFDDSVPEVRLRFQEPKAKDLTRGYPNLQCRLESFLQAGLCLQQGRVAACPPPSCWYPSN